MTLFTHRKQNTRWTIHLCEAYKGFKEPGIPIKKTLHQWKHSVSEGLNNESAWWGNLLRAVLCAHTSWLMSGLQFEGFTDPLWLLTNSWTDYLELVPPACLCSRQDAAKRLRSPSSSFEPLMVTSFACWSARLTSLTPENFSAIR